MRAYHRGVSVEDGAARPEVARRSSIQVRRPLARDRAPVKIAFLIGILQQAEPGGVRAAQFQGGVGEPL
jgi:hypothetical protein